MLQRNRTLTGSGTCRSRHVKCDESRPMCQKCQQQGLICLGYESQLMWAKDGLQDSPQNLDRVFRRPLFSVEDQERMTRMTVDSLGRQSATAALTKLDGEHGRAESCWEHDSFRGPFGVLKLSLSVASPSGHDASQPDPAESSQADWDFFWPPLDSAPTIAEDNHLFDGLYDIAEDVEDVPRADLSLDVDPIPNNLEVLLPDATSLPMSLIPNPSLALLRSKYIPSQAPALLRYFKENIISLSFPLKNCQKCPWQAIHLPTAMSTYAELSIHQTASHTRLSLFYSLLAASCLHMFSRNPNAVDLNMSSKGFTQIAKQHLEVALNEEVLGSRRAKYKELLMAVLSMVMLSIFHGENSNAQAFLVDAEYLIRIRGLPKPHKSLKVRSLHHVYTYIRIMAESTCGCALLDICPDRPSSSLLAIESSPLSLRSFRVAHDSLDEEIDLTLEKSDEVGHNDIHLEVMGQWKDTLYPDIYGIPESLMILLSQTIRVANERELLHRNTTVDTNVLQDLEKRASLLEQYILSWEPPSRPQPSLIRHTIENSEDSDHNTSQLLMRAMHQALILFYYRRIPNISALILQDTVRKCLDFLQRSDNARVESVSNDTVILWPGFVAACEALDPDLQRGLLDWLVTTGHRTSLSSFSAAAKTAQMVWEARDKAKDYTLSWFDVMKHERCPIIAT
ncbi:fungal-specific transcription factor domain-containing protein [Aspergillus caelatus]|uniref:Fungal-specific transcription factor domain-containing protein n=1 Tax=Aspergillus caelatus TaxID=61420 RepID=A0A5N7ADJ9_9EURO|nr:fungal-specific transcription factor domain-containing protein [Aspergillus caelatus]KAE8367246.1 fungal-specific transcription factor domain-containing protein [Aspergillus caelatus]